MIFLIHYDRTMRRLISIEPFVEREKASKAKLRKEISLLASSNGHEVVLLEALDEESLRKTHRRYFDSLTEIAAGESKTYEPPRGGFVKYWNVHLERTLWRVTADGVPETRYPSKELAVGAAAKDARSWNKATGNATGIRLLSNGGWSIEALFGDAKSEANEKKT